MLSLFKRHRFPVEIIMLCVRWYCKYGISYRDLAEMMSERGVAVDPSTIFRWVQRYATEIEKRIRLYQGPRSGSWRVDETYVRVGGRWKYLFRAVDKHGRLIAFVLSDRRNTNAAYRFLRKAIKAMSTYPLSSITRDKLASYPRTLLRQQNEGLLPNDVAHRTSKYLNKILEADHGALKRGFQTMKTAAATLTGFDIMRMIRGHYNKRGCGATGEIRLIISSSDLLPERPVQRGSLCRFQITATVPVQQPRFAGCHRHGGFAPRCTQAMSIIGPIGWMTSQADCSPVRPHCAADTLGPKDHRRQAST